MTTTSSPFNFSFGAALDDGTLYMAGVARELEDREVHHTIIWERVQGVWKRYQWKNRTYSMTAYTSDSRGNTVVCMGFEGTIKVRSTVHGSIEEVVEADDGPSSAHDLIDPGHR
jgi:hypothetical protein